MAFMARLRAAAGESQLALRLRFRSWLRPVRRKWTPAAADSAVEAAQRGRNGGLLTLALFQLGTARNRLRSFPRKRRQGSWRRKRGEAPVRSRYVRFTAIATELMPRAELTRCARDGLPQRQSSRTVRGTLVGSQRI